MHPFIRTCFFCGAAFFFASIGIAAQPTRINLENYGAIPTTQNANATNVAGRYRMPMIQVITAPANTLSAYACPTNPLTPGLSVFDKFASRSSNRGYVWYSCLVIVDFPLDSVTKSALNSWQNCDRIPVSKTMSPGLKCTFQYSQSEPPITTFVVPNDALGGNAFAYREAHMYTTTGAVSSTFFPTQFYGGTTFSGGAQLVYPGSSGISVTLPAYVGEEIASANTGSVKTNIQIDFNLPVPIPQISVTP